MIDDVLREVRAAGECFSRAKIRRLEVEGDAVTVFVISNRAYAPADFQNIAKALRKFVPEEFELEVKIEKIAPDEGMVEERIREEIKKDFPTAYYALEPGDVKVSRAGEGFRFEISVPSIFASLDAMKKAVTGALEKSFCEEVSGECVEKKEVKKAEVTRRNETADFKAEARTFPIRDFKALTGDYEQDEAVYISDIEYADGDFCICGVLSDFQEKSYVSTRTGEARKFYIFSVSDPTGTCETKIFPTVRMLDDIASLRDGDSVVCSGKNELYRGRWDFKTDRIDFGKVPSDFSPKRRKSRPAPRDYVCVRPESYSDLSQGNMFGEKKSSGPKGTYVVFDLETTGLNSYSLSGTMDDIIELGACKIVDGTICERLSTYVKPTKEITREITDLTGITPDMVSDAPEIGDVMADFFLFTRGATLVGHNVIGFDWKFIDFYAQREGYVFDNEIVDTLQLAKSSLPSLKNYKLATVAGAFGIEFTPHRAVDDALATAKVFLNLKKA